MFQRLLVLSPAGLFGARGAMPRQRSKRIGRGTGGDWPALIGPYGASARAAFVGLATRLELKQHAVSLIDFIDRRPGEGKSAEENVASAGIGRDESVALMLDQRGNNALRGRRQVGFRLNFHDFTTVSGCPTNLTAFILAFYWLRGKPAGGELR